MTGFSIRLPAILIASGVIAILAPMRSDRAMGAEPAVGGAEPLMRRLSADQYRQIVADVFGPTIVLHGRLEPDIRQDGLEALGASRISVSGSGLEQYNALADSIASQVIDSEQRRKTLIPCVPVSVAVADPVCAGRTLGAMGRLLFRRPLNAEQLKGYVAVAGAASDATKNFYTGLKLSVADMLVSPDFLFQQQVTEADPDHPGQYRLDAFSKASRLSFLLWNTAPDDALLAAAENGTLNTASGLRREVDRLLASPRLEGGIRAFFADMLALDDFATLSKDSAIFPKYTVEVARDAKEQMLRTIVDLLVTRNGDYRDLFTSRRTFLTPALGATYRVPVADDETVANGFPSAWQPFEFPEGDVRGVGILSQVGFVALHSHPGRSSPTLRGKAVREILLCQKVPNPPANVNFTVVQDTANPRYKTARERVTAHRTDPVCAGCHKIMDPIGLALETFDSSGVYRATENGAKIDTGGEFDGVQFADAVGLGKAVHDHPATASCLVNRLYAYANGQNPAKGDAEFVRYLEKSFADGGYRVPSLLRRIATSDDFYRVPAPQTGSLNLDEARQASRSAAQEKPR